MPGSGGPSSVNTAPTAATAARTRSKPASDRSRLDPGAVSTQQFGQAKLAEASLQCTPGRIRWVVLFHQRICLMSRRMISVRCCGRVHTGSALRRRPARLSDLRQLERVFSRLLPTGRFLAKPLAPSVEETLSKGQILRRSSGSAGSSGSGTITASPVQQWLLSRPRQARHRNCAILAGMSRRGVLQGSSCRRLAH